METSSLSTTKSRTANASLLFPISQILRRASLRGLFHSLNSVAIRAKHDDIRPNISKNWNYSMPITRPLIPPTSFAFQIRQALFSDEIIRSRISNPVAHIAPITIKNPAMPETFLANQPTARTLTPNC